MTRRRKPHVILGTLEDVSDEALQSKAEIVLTCPAAYLAARRGLSETDDAGDSGSGQMPTGDNTSDGDLPGAGEPAPEQLPETTDNEDWAYREAATRARRAMYAQEARLTDLGVTSPVTWDVGGTAYDAALLLAHHRGARLIATVGAPNGLDDFLNRGRDGMAGDLLARTVATGRIVDGYAIERMHRPRIGNGLLIVMLLVGLLAIVAAVATTPAGQELMGLSPQWWDNLVTRTKDLL